jgi:hypothetical protein
VESLVPERLAAAMSTMLKSQNDRVEEDLKACKIDRKEYEIRKDQIARNSLLQ